MSRLTFKESDFRWDFDRFAMVLHAYDGERRVICMISGEALEEHFGGKLPREGMEAAFVINRAEIEEKARELYEAGAISKEGRVLLRSANFQGRETLARS